jgi:hypothetical protein
MPSIATASTSVPYYPNEYSSPYGNDQIVPLYSSVPLKSPVTGCLPCVVCGDSIVRNEIIANSSQKKLGSTDVKITVTPPFYFSGNNLLFKFPCFDNPFNYICPCDSTYQDSGTIISSKSGIFNVTFRVRGVAEPCADYTDPGTPVSGSPYVRKNPSGYTGPYNTYQLQVGSDVYLLNYDTDGLMFAFDYHITLPIPTNTTYTLYANSYDQAEQGNQYSLVATDDDTLRPIQVQQPYGGQFMQLDIISFVYEG